MANIADIIVYPIKSCAGISMESVEISDTGFALDRNWMIIDSNNTAVTQREQPLLALVQPAFAESGLSIRAAGMADLLIALEPTQESANCDLFGEGTTGFIVSDEADRWFSQYLGGAFRLVRKDAASYRAGGVQYPERDAAPTNFVDNYGILVVSRASIEDLNRSTPAEIHINRFRPNLVLDGIEAFAEDFLESAESDGILLRFTNICYRCNLINVNQTTAEITETTFDTLSMQRRVNEGVKLGNYAAIQDGVGQKLTKGSEIELTLGF